MFSDYLVFVDESGDHSLEAIDPDYPVFVLSMCVIRKDRYVAHVVPALKRLKVQTFGHDAVVLHENEIRRKKGPFTMLSREPRERFLDALTDIIDAAEFKLFAVVIDKQKMRARYARPAHVYHLAMEFGLERIYRLLQGERQTDGITHVVCECRGKAEDAELELAFRRICDGANFFNQPLPFDIVMADKKSNSEGLQLADLTARPIGLSVFRPTQANRTYDILDRKLHRDARGVKLGVGLKVFP